VKKCTSPDSTKGTPPNPIAGVGGFFIGKTRGLLSAGYFDDQKFLLSRNDEPPQGFGPADEGGYRGRRRSGRELYEKADQNYQRLCRIPFSDVVPS
jgi:hypothetical protein